MSFAADLATVLTRDAGREWNLGSPVQGTAGCGRWLVASRRMVRRANMRKIVTVVVVSTASMNLWAVEYECRAAQKLNPAHVYTPEEIKRWGFSVLIEESGAKTFASRCSVSSVQSKVTCDRYEVDRTEFDEHIKAKKYYVFRSQFDVQVFANLSFVENNGRGDVAFGNCRVSAP